MNQKLTWHAPVFRSLEANRTAQGDTVFNGSDDFIDDVAYSGDEYVPGSVGVADGS